MAPEQLLAASLLHSMWGWAPMSALLSGFTGLLFYGNTAAVPPAAYFFCCARTLTLCRGRCPHRPSFSDSPELPCVRQGRSRAFGDILFLLRQKKYAKRGAEDALYCALTRAIFWPLCGLNALFGRKNVRLPIAYGSDQCTTRRCGQTVSTSVLLISGIPNQLISMHSML